MTAGATGLQVWLPWVVGSAVLAAVVVLAFNASDERAFLVLAGRVSAWWLSAAIVLQAATYVVQGAIWRRIAARAGQPLGALAAAGLSLAKLFADQALPSAGVSGSLLVAGALERRRLPADVVKAAVLVNLVAYHLAYVASLIVAVALLRRADALTSLVAWSTLAFVAFALALSAAIVILPGRHIPEARVARVGLIRSSMEFAEGARPGLVRDTGLLVHATVLQLMIVLLDTATFWTLVHAVGATLRPDRLFAGFMVASLVRTIGIVPGGLGTFEAAAVLALRSAGAPIHVALSATLLFRGLSFWLPMAPGFWLSRRLVGGAPVEQRPVGLGTYWSLPAADVVDRLGGDPGGLSSGAASERRERFGPNALGERTRRSRLDVLVDQLRSPLLLLLVFAAAASAATGQWLDATIVIGIVAATVGVGFSREAGAQAAVEALQARVQVLATVLRDGAQRRVVFEDLVPGDVLVLSAGCVVPADAVLLEANDFFVSEAALTGESLPVEKRPGPVEATAPLSARTGCVFLGTNVRSGTARCIVVGTGRSTELGAIAHRLALRPPEAEFDRGIRRFGLMLTSAMLIIVLLVFFAHVLAGRPPIETLLFAVALAVGLSPELLPAILGVNLARGAQLMARRGVLVRRLNAIENLGSMDVLCTDKTGTLTEGVVRLDGAFDTAGQRCTHVQWLGGANAALATGLATPLDDAILAADSPDLTGMAKRAEVPFDFVRKRVSVVIVDGKGPLLVTKGAVPQVLEVSSRTADGRLMDAATVADLQARFESWSNRGIRVLAVGTRRLAERQSYGRDDERDITFEGFLTFLDRPKADAADALRSLAAHGVSTKIITGDHHLVSAHVASLVGMPNARVLTGRQIDELADTALGRAAESTEIFAEVDPVQKERLIRVLRAAGHVVGFLGDGVNDAPAMHAADTSLAVETAVDVARDAADFVLLERDLDVIRGGIEEGRRTFANTLKYILITTSANLGNMISMAVASLFLPFLPLLASQILLNNFLSDIPAVGLADDDVDPELVDKPERWNIAFIRRYMVDFGLVSSAFDVVTFVTLIGVFHAAPTLFRTGWFVESLLTELVIALVVRTRRPFYRSRPGRVLLWTTMALVPVALLLPSMPIASLLGFVPLPVPLVATILLITGLYVAAVEGLKRWFYDSPRTTGRAMRRPSVPSAPAPRVSGAGPA